MKYGSRLRAPKYMTGSTVSLFLKNKNLVGPLLGVFRKKAVTLQPVSHGKMVSWPSG